MAFIDAFVGAPQSQLAGYAFLLTLIVVGIAVLVGKESIPLSQKFIVVLLMVLMALPAILLTLLQVTCMVTGDAGGNKWWCTVYAWYISIVIVFSSAVVIIGAILSMIDEKKTEKFVDSQASGMATPAVAMAKLEEANKAAKKYFEAMQVEKFQDEATAQAAAEAEAEMAATAGAVAPTEVGLPPSPEMGGAAPRRATPTPPPAMEQEPQVAPAAFAAVEPFTSSCAQF